MKPRIHPTAIVEPGAELGEDVHVGPYSVVQAGARIGARCRLESHVVVMGSAALGEANHLFPFAVVGGEAQLAKGQAEGAALPAKAPRLVVGDRNVFREHVTVNLGSRAPTRIGSDNLFMTGAHVAHDVTVGSRCVVANAVQLAGHVTVEDHVTFGGLSGCRQFVRVGESAFVAAGAMCERDVPRYVIVQGDRARVRALNRVGLERRGVPPEQVARLEAAFRALFGGRIPRARALAELDRTDPLVARLAASLEVSPSR
jgi:UDP-N-acetylglucosamine acyltransferase